MRVDLTLPQIKALIDAAEAGLAGDGEGDVPGEIFPQLRRASERLKGVRDGGHWHEAVPDARDEAVAALDAAMERIASFGNNGDEIADALIERCRTALEKCQGPKR